MVKQARELGAALVIVHGESVVEPVASGTNLAGLEAGADILAHPGLITPEDAELAALKKIFLEISGRTGHGLSNGHVAKIAVESGARLILNSDAHGPLDLMTEEYAIKVVKGAGLSSVSLNDLLSNSCRLLNRIGYSL